MKIRIVTHPKAEWIEQDAPRADIAVRTESITIDSLAMGRAGTPFGATALILEL